MLSIHFTSLCITSTLVSFIKIGGSRGGFSDRGASRGGRGAPRGRYISHFSSLFTFQRGGVGAARGGARGGAKVVVEPHRHEGVFVARGKEDLLVTKNLCPGESVYGEKRISVENGDGTKTEYRVWNPFRSKVNCSIYCSIRLIYTIQLAAGILGGIDHVHIAPGKKVLYLGGSSGTTVSHVADIVGPVNFIILTLSF